MDLEDSSNLSLTKLTHVPYQRLETQIMVRSHQHANMVMPPYMHELEKITYINYLCKVVNLNR